MMRIEETGNDGAGGPPGSEDRTAGGADGAELAGDPGCGEEGEAAYARGTGRCRGRVAERRRPFTFVLDPLLVERARREVGDKDMVRSIEAALAAAIDYQHWVREVSSGNRSVLS